MMATPFENALLKPKRSARWNPLPYAISDVTVRMPHAMPSIVKPARNRCATSESHAWVMKHFSSDSSMRRL